MTTARAWQDHHRSAQALRWAGNHWFRGARLVQAEAVLQQALALAEAACGPRHPQTAATLTTLGQVRQAQGDVAGARVAYTRALHGFQQQPQWHGREIQIVQELLDALDAP